MLDLYSDSTGISISLNDFLLLSFPNVYAPPIRSSMDCRIDSFSPSVLFSSKNLFILGDFTCQHPLGLKSTYDPRGEEKIDWVISSDSFTLNNPDLPTLLHRSSGICSSTDISFVPFSLLFLGGALEPGS